MNGMLTQMARHGRLLALCVGAVVLLGNQAVADSPLEELLLRTGRTVELYWQQVASYACTEIVTQEKIGNKEKTEYRTASTYDYLAITKVDEEGLTIEELRLPIKISSKKSKPPSLLSTNGFPTLLLIFHPRYQTNYRYEIKPAGVENGRLLAVHFEQIPGMQSTCALVLQERIYPLVLQGTAWIDAETGTIQKMTATLVTPLKDINIKAFSAEIAYQPQRFSHDSEPKWLPSAATISVDTALQHWRNIHRFSQYRRFTVESVQSVLK
jgi:hypothetical protein